MREWWTINKPTDPKKNWWTFAWWEDWRWNVWDFSGAVAEPMTLYASWVSVANGAKYSVKHRKQSGIGSSDYELAQTIESSWYAGSWVNEVINERIAKKEYIWYNSGACTSTDTVLDWDKTTERQKHFFFRERD